jgi:hypothetical protein
MFHAGQRRPGRGPWTDRADSLGVHVRFHHVRRRTIDGSWPAAVVLCGSVPGVVRPPLVGFRHPCLPTCTPRRRDVLRSQSDVPLQRQWREHKAGACSLSNLRTRFSAALASGGSFAATGTGEDDRCATRGLRQLPRHGIQLRLYTDGCRPTRLQIICPDEPAPPLTCPGRGSSITPPTHLTSRWRRWTFTSPTRRFPWIRQNQR